MADKQAEAQKKGQANNVAAQKAQTAGRASEVAPIPNSQNRPKKFTSTKQGGAQKTSETASANAQSKDVTKVGLFSAFGGGGMRSKLDQAYSGSGEVLGQADRATGTSGFNEDRAGDDLGSKFKATGAGGKGTATQGIAGIGTKGRGSGQSAYGATDGFGSKTSVAVEAGGAEEDFVGTIDKEAVRRRVRHYLHEIRGCYNRELNRVDKGHRLEGKVIVTWLIGAKGVASNVRIKSSTLGNASVENCIRERLASWSFPEPPVGMTAEVSYPFYLRPEN
ncbi:MAG: AgmX/PglI C-terminal domain-containing protein [Bdellovibrionaceae bacterium]|nr:AgmX/PglI C-terminal domain-containing protein [Pseudobdellovibrionaceae bacterium]